MEFEKKKWETLTRAEQDAALRFVPQTFDQTMAADFQKCVVDIEVSKEDSEFDLGKI